MEPQSYFRLVLNNLRVAPLHVQLVFQPTSDISEKYGRPTPDPLHTACLQIRLLDASSSHIIEGLDGALIRGEQGAIDQAAADQLHLD